MSGHAPGKKADIGSSGLKSKGSSKLQLMWGNKNTGQEGMCSSVV